MRADKVNPRVFLNHVVVVLDTATYRGVEQSAFLRRFAPTERRTTVMNGRSHTGFYLYGTRTYLEFLGASEQQAGSGGFALGVDQTGALQALRDAAAPHLIVEQREYGGVPVPWFYLGGQPNFPSHDLAVWLMEYHPQFLAEWHPGLSGQGVSREEVLKRYKAVLADATTEPYLEDIVGVTVAANQKTHESLTELARLLGYSEQNVGNATLITGPELKVRLVRPTGEERGVREVTMRVKGWPVEERKHHFGPKSVLRFQGERLTV